MVYWKSVVFGTFGPQHWSTSSAAIESLARFLLFNSIATNSTTAELVIFIGMRGLASET